MKTLKPILKACSLILLLAFASCKKDGGVKPDAKSTAPVTAADLVDYNIPIALSSASGLRVIYFNKDGNDIKATLDAVSARRVYTVNLVNNTWTLDSNGDGSVIYTFTFGRRDDGVVTITEANYKKLSDVSIRMGNRFLKNADIPSFANARFSAAGNNALFVKFSDQHQFAVATNANYAGSGWTSYYDLCPGAWKGTYNGVDYMGVTIVPNPGEPIQMYVQKATEANAFTLNPY